MNRKYFIEKSLLGLLGTAIGSSTPYTRHAKPRHSTYDKMMEQVGFNHLPNKETRTMKSVLHKAASRGRANHGWLDSHHSFSFANYYNPERMHFGALRVLNDDVVDGGKGFNTHPHDNMEIISIPLEGDLEHKDNMGNVAIIRKGDIQVMSAGKGVYHREYNKHMDSKVNFLQIWVIPNKKNVIPRYDQITIERSKAKNQFQQILSPVAEDEGVWIHQNAWFQIGELKTGSEELYTVKDMNNGVYAFMLKGNATIEGQELSERDGFGVWDVEKININVTEDAKILLMDVPMNT